MFFKIFYNNLIPFITSLVFFIIISFILMMFFLFLLKDKNKINAYLQK